MRRAVCVGLAVIVCGVLPAGSAAALACGRHDLVLARLGEQFRERVVAQALQEDGRLLELLASPGGATWTALLTAADGVACIVAAGRHLALLPPAAAGDES